MKTILFIALSAIAGIANAQLQPAQPSYCDTRNRPCITMNDYGDYFGQIMNVSSGTWALGYAAAGTANVSNGTSALTWTNAGVVTVPGTLSVATLSISSTAVNGYVTVTSFLGLPAQTSAQIVALTPTAAGHVHYCSNCAVPLCISTGTAKGALSLITSSTSACQ